jgi:hypothetical protein
MAASISRTGKKSRGRPRKDPISIHLTLLPESLLALDRWIDGQADKPSRPEAIRRLIEQALAGAGISRQPRKAVAHKASTLAAREIEKLADNSQPLEERHRRKRSLIRGPREFRDIRHDQPKQEE